MNIQKIQPSGIFTNYIYKAIPYAFDESMSYYETLCGVLSLLKTQIEVINNNADLIAELENFTMNYFNNLNVQQEINHKLDEMVEDGTFDEIINDKLFNDIDRQLHQLTNEINTIEESVDEKIDLLNDKKIDKNGVEQVQYTNLSQEIKEMFTGGNTPVVAENSVSTSNIVDKAVTPPKLFDGVLQNMINLEKITTGGYYYNNSYTESANYSYIKIEIEPSTDYMCEHLRFADFFNEEDVFISGVSINWAGTTAKEFTSPDNAKYIRISWNSNTYDTNTLQKINGYSAFDYGTYKVTNNIDINKLNENCLNTFNGMVENLHLIDGYYVETNGRLRTNVNFYTTPLLNVYNGDTMYFSQARTVAWYDKDLNLVHFDNNTGLLEIQLQVPENARYCRASFSKSYFENAMIYSFNDINFLSEKLSNKISFKELYFEKSSNSLTSNTLLEVTKNIDIKKNCSYNAYCEFESFDTLFIGHGEDDYGGGYLKIDNTNIYIYMRKGSDASATLYDTIAHGLTISNYLNIDIKQAKNSSYISITLTTSTGQFNVDNKLFQACNGKIYIKPYGMTVSNANMKYILNDLNQKIYLFGDSYIGIDSTDRYAYYLMQNNYDNILLSGYPGENSQNSLVCLNKLFNKQIPKMVIWTLGMNDGDSSSINSNWKNAVDSLIALCNANDVTLILATIPNTPTVKNTLKNEYVKNTGLRYIDFAKCVGAELENATWYTGCLSSDNVHPTQTGAKLLYAQLLHDVPEIIQEN